MTPIDELIREMTTDEVKASLYLLYTTLGLSTTAWQRLSPLRTITAVLARLIAGFSRLQAIVNKSGFLDYAVGDFLTFLAFYVYNVLREPATFAPGEVTVINAGGGLYAYGIGDLVVLNTTTSKTYRNTAAVTVNPLATVTVAIEALEQGEDSTAAPGQIDAFVAASPSLSVTNAAAVVGQNAELDPSLRQRCRDSLGALSPNGPAAAYAAIAKSAKRADGTSVGVTREIAYVTNALGVSAVYVATASGALSGPDLAIVDTAIQKYAVATGFTANVANAVVHSVGVVVDVWVSSELNLTSADVQALIGAAVSQWFATIPIGGLVLPPAAGKLSWKALLGIIEGIKASSDADAPLVVLEAVLTGPAADVALATNEVAVLTSVTTTVTLV